MKKIESNYYEGDEYFLGVARARTALNATLLEFCKAEGRHLGLSPKLGMLSVTVIVHAFAETLAIAMAQLEHDRDADDLKAMFAMMTMLMRDVGEPTIDWACKERKRRKVKT
jgi:hypothetical protein